METPYAAIHEVAPKEEACLGRARIMLGFKERRSFLSWLVVSAVMVVFAVSVVPLMDPSTMERRMAPGEYYLHKDKKERMIIHVISVFGWMLLGLVQFVPRVRRVALGYHRWAGRVYFVCCAVLAASGFLMTGYAFGGSWSIWTASMTIFTCFVTTTVFGIVRIKQRRIKEHQAWMLRNYACGSSVLWSRLSVALGMTRQFSEQWGVMECGQVLYELQEEPEDLQQYFPNCVADPSQHTAVSTTGDTMASIIVSGRLAFGLGLWLGFIINMTAVELWIHRLEQIESEPQAESMTKPETVAKPAE
mmetsp:Transcript_49380/g.117487  ORF Transcript_49380/g.117487 Transcript_49380/m.117487 type:complete len:304 (+) Transcript_49380:114-1025(+)|eukprot:CAMPEP_0178401508 /NCGR_PEP_ID=MMETSP0689_2-20121128/16338_1 /TAXON_ID=160604 /ORGANISM="Amphidinium massartii, Strain CS-259" /LENGTH=303 /DNA_ID=CAMNT_0020022331 /DNA_START=56 /DNA_END=967 /DNA_ORIENTATION=+